MPVFIGHSLAKFRNSVSECFKDQAWSSQGSYLEIQSGKSLHFLA